MKELKQFVGFVKERWEILQRREAGKSKQAEELLRGVEK